MSAYYNEFDPFAAQWLRNLIARGLIAPGDVDDRSIRDVQPGDLDGYTQCHFFAGVGVWSHALRQAGWPDTRPVWTASCPCQPFSAAGRARGLADERHLWPEVIRLVRERRPVVLLGEQVASKDGLNWLDLVQADMEGEDYALGAVDLCAAGVGAPHRRQRLWFVGHPIGEGLEGHAGDGDGAGGRKVAPRSASEAGVSGLLADTSGARRERGRSGPGETVGGGTFGAADRSGDADRVAHADDTERRTDDPSRNDGDGPSPGRFEGHGEPGTGVQAGGMDDAQCDGRRAGRGDNAGHDGLIVGPTGSAFRPGPVNGFWRDADWLLCRDPGGPRWRPVEPGTFPLADGVAARVGRLRGYGNALNAQAAQAFIEVAMEALP